MVHATAARLAFRIASSAPLGATYRAGMAISRLRLGGNPPRGASQVRSRASIALGRLLANEDFPLASMIRGADDPLFLHALHDRGRAVVADLQPALDVTRGRLAVAHNDLHGLLIKVVGLSPAHGATTPVCALRRAVAIANPARLRRLPRRDMQ